MSHDSRPPATVCHAAVQGLNSFKGEAIHTARWPRDPVRFEGKRVAVIGTGATGFHAITGALGRIGIQGENGLKPIDKWKDGPQTCLGRMVEHFPNMMMPMGPHIALGNIPRGVEYNVDWVTGIEGKNVRVIARFGGSAPACRERRDQMAAEGCRKLSAA